MREEPGIPDSPTRPTTLGVILNTTPADFGVGVDAVELDTGELVMVLISGYKFSYGIVANREDDYRM